MRVGFLGAGHIATFHSKMLRAGRADATWAGVHDPDRARADAFARASGATVCDSEDEVLAGCDAVYICTWTSEHERLVRAAVERGLAVFCEKPLAPNLDGARRMADVVDAAGVINQVGLILRRSPAFMVLRDLVADDAAGRVLAVVFRDDQWLPVPGAYGSTWRGDASRAGSGVLLEHSIHDVDILEHTVGRVRSVSARSRNVHGLVGIEDVVVATLELDGGALATLTTVWHDVAPRGSLRRVEVLCERRWVALEGDWFGPVRWTDAGGAERVLDGEALQARAVELGGGDNPDAAFVDAAAAHRPATPSFRDAVRPHELVDAIYRSAASGGASISV